VTQRSTDWLRTMGEDHRSYTDLRPVVALLGQARVVALGEGAHNIEEMLGVRNHLMRLLVAEHGFTAVVMESGLAEGLAVDAFVHGGAGEATDVARESISYRFGECAPAVEQLTWLRAHNDGLPEPGRAHWWGMDLPGDSTSPEPALRACLARLPAEPGDDELLRLADLDRRSRAAIRWQALGDAERRRVYDGIDDVVRRADAHGDAVTRQCAASLVAFAAETRWSVATDDGGAYPRDVFMAQAVRWLLDRHERILVCAHNAHVRRTSLDGRPMMGQLLAEDLGDDLRVIGQTYGAGPEVRYRDRSERPFDWEVDLVARELAPGSLEQVVEDAVADQPGGATYLVVPGLHPGLPDGEAFDAVIHHRRVRQVPGAFDRLREDLEQA